FQFVGPSGDTTTFTYHAVLLPQSGGIVASEKIVQGVAGGSGMDVTWRLGELPKEAAK
ncbi:MAG: hypothetical protein V7636_2915, partial [Actinomycetota bacterium]